jgi:hypothetical protein
VVQGVSKIIFQKYKKKKSERLEAQCVNTWTSWPVAMGGGWKTNVPFSLGPAGAP